MELVSDKLWSEGDSLAQLEDGQTNQRDAIKSWRQGAFG